MNAPLHAVSDPEVASNDANVVATDDYSSNTETVGRAVVGASVLGRIEAPDDQDWFKVELLAGMSYEIDLEWVADSSFDPVLLGIYDESGQLLKGTFNDDGGEGKNSRVLFTPSEGGTYFISAGAFRNDIGSYSLSVSRFEDDSTMHSPTKILVGAEHVGKIEVEREVDLFIVELERGRYYQIDVEGADTEKGTLGDPYLIDIRHVNGSDAPSPNDNGGVGFNSRSQYLAKEMGYHYIEVSGAPQGETGTYTIGVREITDDYDWEYGVLGPSESSAATWTASGALEVGGDSDSFRLEVETGWTYDITLQGLKPNGASLQVSGGGVLDSLYLDDEGVVQWRPTEGEDQLRIFAERDGTVTVTVSGGKHQGVGEYSLTAVGTPPASSDEDTSSKTVTSWLPVELLWHDDPIFAISHPSLINWQPSDLDFLRPTWEANSPDVFPDLFEKLVTSEELEGRPRSQVGDSASTIRDVEQANTPQGFPFDDPLIESDLSSETEWSWGVPDIDLF